MNELYQEILEDFEAYCCCDNELSKKCLQNDEIKKLKETIQNNISYSLENIWSRFENELNNIQYNYCVELIKFVSKRLYNLYKNILK